MLPFPVLKFPASWPDGGSIEYWWAPSLQCLNPQCWGFVTSVWGGICKLWWASNNNHSLQHVSYASYYRSQSWSYIKHGLFERVFWITPSGNSQLILNLYIIWKGSCRYAIWTDGHWDPLHFIVIMILLILDIGFLLVYTRCLQTF